MLDTGDQPRLVISAVNFTEGGPLTVLREVVSAARHGFPEWRIHVVVHRKGLVDVEGIEEIVYPEAKRSWLRRLWCEWFVLNRLSIQLKPDVWLSLHDMTPRVRARRQYVYCHNPAPFTDLPWRLRLKDRSFLLFSLFYAWLYRINIHRNDAVIVQQSWLREEFQRRFGVRRVVVAHPRVSASPAETAVSKAASDGPTRFFFPCLPRVHKNIELLGRCAELLESDRRWQGRLVVTVDGTESTYARSLVDTYGALRSIEFIGAQKPAGMAAQYQACDALIFPSLLETWGLPLTEAKVRGIPILAAELPYARETVGDCDAVQFFDPRDARALADLLIDLSQGRRRFEAVRQPPPDAPFTDGWRALLQLMLVDDETTPVMQRPRDAAVASRMPAS